METKHRIAFGIHLPIFRNAFIVTAHVTKDQADKIRDAIQFLKGIAEGSGRHDVAEALTYEEH